MLEGSNPAAERRPLRSPAFQGREAFVLTLMCRRATPERLASLRPRHRPGEVRPAVQSSVGFILEGSVQSRNRPKGLDGQTPKESSFGIKGLPTEPTPGFWRARKHALVIT